MYIPQALICFACFLFSCYDSGQPESKGVDFDSRHSKRDFCFCKTTSNMTIQWISLSWLGLEIEHFGEVGGNLQRSNIWFWGSKHTWETAISRAILPTRPKCSDLIERSSPGCRMHLFAFGDYLNSQKDVIINSVYFRPPNVSTALNGKPSLIIKPCF